MKRYLTPVFLLLPLLILAKDPARKMHVVCSFSPLPISPTILDRTHKASDYYTDLITRMFAYCGQRHLPLFIGDAKSADLDFACCGYTESGQPAIIFNGERFATISKVAAISILAHEIGHFRDGHINDSVLTRQMELDADWHNGFWCSRNGFDPDSIVFEPYHWVDSDALHPPYLERIKEVESGYILGKTVFNTASWVKNKRDFPLSDTLQRQIDLIVTVEPGFTQDDTTKKFVVRLNIAPTGKGNFSDAAIFQQIKYVRYVADVTFGKRYLRSDESDSNFRFRLTDVWGDFPVTAIIHFVDDTEMSITKSFILPQ
ncbi:hypothetical protein KXD93_30425 [Mucilaginibacter sp. BJC16-A38]|uniref:pYEATS domain-containing protein n=1 Tax=Mucilaginibacter phenanthrenivorans TaxID=1234842 RepID=UPI0021577D54|nr:pYEATS domain-containing protein [Mucilaginibacter phenanthrenivorans]MCR8562010.1 hypothetical protein [Mucilaginibacter phenanthrenivorans]